MYPEDRVLVVYLPRLEDFALVRGEGWYRIPQQHAPKGLHAEYFAFYFGRQFGPQKWAIHYYARNHGHELVTRRELFANEPDHPRAADLYYKVQLGPLQTRAQPIVSLRWRRVTFIHTTWDRFCDAVEINDLLIEGDPYVDRLFATLKERGIHAEKGYQLKEDHRAYEPLLVIPCQQGQVEILRNRKPASLAEVERLVGEIIQETGEKGGPL